MLSYDERLVTLRAS